MYMRTMFTACIQFNNVGTDMNFLLLINKTYRMKTCVAVLFCWLIIIPAFSQAETGWIRFGERTILDRVMNMEYSHPAGFLGDSTKILCSEITSGSCLAVSLSTEDLSFIAFYDIHNPVTKEDSIFYSNAIDSSGKPINTPVDNNSLFVKFTVQKSFGNDANWKDYVHYYPSDEAKSKFNADTVLSIVIPLDVNEDYKDIKAPTRPPPVGIELFQGDYSHCTVLIIQKRGRGCVAIYCLYDEKKVPDVGAHIAAIEGTLKYRDGEPELKKLENFSPAVVRGLRRPPS